MPYAEEQQRAEPHCTCERAATPCGCSLELASVAAAAAAALLLTGCFSIHRECSSMWCIASCKLSCYIVPLLSICFGCVSDSLRFPGGSPLITSHVGCLAFWWCIDSAQPPHDSFMLLWCPCMQHVVAACDGALIDCHAGHYVRDGHHNLLITPERV